jgi:hypothetical protein
LQFYIPSGGAFGCKTCFWRQGWETQPVKNVASAGNAARPGQAAQAAVARRLRGPGSAAAPCTAARHVVRPGGAWQRGQTSPGGAGRRAGPAGGGRGRGRRWWHWWAGPPGRPPPAHERNLNGHWNPRPTSLTVRIRAILVVWLTKKQLKLRAIIHDSPPPRARRPRPPARVCV